jgi:hypothetical protein
VTRPGCSWWAAMRTWSLSQRRKMRLRALAHSGRSVWLSGSYSGAIGCTTGGGGQREGAQR